MDCVLPKKDLMRIVRLVRPVANNESSIPMLANVLLSVAGNSMQVSATDGRGAISGAAPAEVSADGSAAVDAEVLESCLSAMPDGPIQITSTNTARVTLRASGTSRRYTLQGIPGNEFPQLHRPAADAPSLELPVDKLSLLITRTHFSISTDETRPHVNSGLFEWAGDRVRLVSTDGHRLSKMESTVTGSSATATMLIPLKAITELRRLADEAKAEKDAPTVSITQSGPNAFFNIAGMQFSVKLVDAQFPPYQQVIPMTDTTQARTNRRLLINAIEACTAVYPPVMRLRKLVGQTWSRRKGGFAGGILLATNGGESIEVTKCGHDSAFSEMVAVERMGPEARRSLDPRFILEALDAIDDDQVLLGFGASEMDPITIRPAAESGADSYIHVLMPRRDV